jgi:hypothetical protein
MAPFVLNFNLAGLSIHSNVFLNLIVAGLRGRVALVWLRIVADLLIPLRLEVRFSFENC